MDNMVNPFDKEYHLKQTTAKDEYHLLHLLNKMTQALISAPNQSALYEIVLDRVPELVAADRVDILLNHPDSTEFETVAATGYVDAFPVGTRWRKCTDKLDSSLLKEPSTSLPLLSEAKADVREMHAVLGLNSDLEVPLTIDDAIVGWLHIASTNVDQYSHKDSLILDQIASILSMALLNQRLADKAEQAIVELEETTGILDSIIEHSPMDLVVKDADELRYTRIGLDKQRYTNLSLEVVIGRTDYELFPKELADSFRETDLVAINEKRALDIPERTLKTATGESRYLIVRKVPIFDKYDRPKYLVSFLQDVTEQRVAEFALRQANLVVEKSPVVLFRWRAEPTIQFEYVSENVNQFGYEAADFLSGRVTFASTIEPSDLLRMDEQVRENIRNGTNDFLQEFRFRDTTGQIRWIENRVNIEYDDNHVATHLQAVAIDVTERKHAEEMLRVNQLCVEHATDSIFWILPDARIAYANEAACQSLGYSKSELESMTIFDIDPTHQEKLVEASTKSVEEQHMARWENAWSRWKKEGTALFETRQYTKDGREIPVEIHCNFQVFHKQEYIFAFVRDLTERKAAEARLREQDELRHMIEFSINSAPHAIFWLNRNGEILNVNDGASQLFGYTRDEFLDLNVRTIDPSYQPANLDTWRMFRKEGAIVLESKLKRQDNKEFPAEIHLSYLLYNQQEYQFAVVQDITERHQMEAQLRRQLQEEELLRDVLTLTTGEGDLTLTMGTICEKMAQFYGIPRAGFALIDVDDTNAEIVAEYVSDDRISSVGTISPIKGNPWMEHVLSHKDAFVVQDASAASDQLPVSSLMRELGIVSLMFVPIMIIDRVVGMLGFDSGELREFQPGDIDLARKVAAHVGQALQRDQILEELVNTGQALKKSEEQLRETLSHLPTPIVIVRRDGTCLYANESFGKMFGATPKYITQQMNAADIYVQVEDRAQLLDDLERDGQLSHHKVSLKMLNGTELWASVSVYSLDYDGETVLLKSIYDLSEQMRSEQILRDAKDAAEAATQTKSLFLSNMTHELRTPMNGVLGMTSILMDTKLDTEQLEIVETIRSSGDTLLTIINDILDFSKIEANKLELELVSFEIAAAIEETTLLVKSTVENKGLQLHYNVDEDVPAWILQDVTRLRQILTNLISNAVKFTSDGEVRIQVSRYLSNSDSDRERTDIQHVNRAEAPSGTLRSNLIKGQEEVVLHFTIEDTGIGIPTERLFRLFRPFSQVDATTTRRYGGTGLGLAISKQLCELMGGKMWVESELGVGTTFHFTITTMAATAAAIPQSDAHTVHTHRAKAFEPNMAAEYPLRILLVEDNVVNQKVALGILKRLGYRADVAANGLEALDAIKRQPYDVILMDIQMPEMDGVTATKRIRSYWSANEQPTIIALTANAMEQHREEYLAAGMDGYVSKPIRVAELSEVLKRSSPLSADV